MFRSVLLTIFLFISCLPSIAQENKSFNATDAMVQVLNLYIRPGYKQLHSHAVGMSDATDRLCNMADAASLKNARQRFSQLVTAWGGVEMIRFGPILGNNLLERYFFFPDRRGSGLKRIKKILAKKQSKALDPAKLTKISVAAQGITALDYVLFGNDVEEMLGTPENFRCQYARSIVHNLRSISKLLDEEWNGQHEFLYLWSTPGYRNPVFAKDSAAVLYLLSTIVHGLEVVRNTRLAAFLKDSPGKDRPKSAPLWRSRNTVRLLLANIASVEKIYRTSNLRQIMPESQIVDAIDMQFDNLRHIIEPDLIVSDSLKNPKARRKIVAFDLALEQLIDTFDKRFAGHLGLSLGFFFDDGD